MPITIESLHHAPSADDLRDLTALLIACVEHGASIGFLSPLDASEAERFWAKIVADLSGGNRVLLVARESDAAPDANGGGERRIVGAAQLAFETRANGRHRAEVQKLMVLPSHRRRGIARHLMHEIESAARARGVRLLFLDTSEGPGGARALYEMLHYAYAGGIPGYALDPDGTPAANAIFYKVLPAG